MERNEFIKHYRITADLSWDELAEIIGVHPTFLQHITAGRMKPGPRTAYKIDRFIAALGAGDPPSQDSLKETNDAGEPAPRGKNS